MKRLPHVTFTNLYGPTETTIASSYYTLTSCPKSEQDIIPNTARDATARSCSYWMGNCVPPRTAASAISISAASAEPRVLERPR